MTGLADGWSPHLYVFADDPAEDVAMQLPSSIDVTAASNEDGLVEITVGGFTTIVGRGVIAVP